MAKTKKLISKLGKIVTRNLKPEDGSSKSDIVEPKGTKDTDQAMTEEDLDLFRDPKVSTVENTIQPKSTSGEEQQEHQNNGNLLHSSTVTIPAYNPLDVFEDDPVIFPPELKRFNELQKSERREQKVKGKTTFKIT
jgi:hypothetical protein